MLKYFKKEMITAQLLQGDVGSYVGGDWVPDFAASQDIKIIVPQPATANDLQQLEDGEHVRDFVRTWSKTRVFTREDDREADRIVTDGDTYKVMQVNDRKELGKFYRVVMHRLEPGTV